MQFLLLSILLSTQYNFSRIFFTRWIFKYIFGIRFLFDVFWLRGGIYDLFEYFTIFRILSVKVKEKVSELRRCIEGMMCACWWDIFSRKGVCLKFARVDFGSRIKRSELAKSVFPRQDNLPRKYVIRLQRLLKQDGIWQRINPRLKVSKNELGNILLLASWHSAFFLTFCFIYIFPFFFSLSLYLSRFNLFLLTLLKANMNNFISLFRNIRKDSIFIYNQ